MGPSRSRPHVLIAGGGVAGVEALLALRALAGPGPSIELLSPDPDLMYRPLWVTEPFRLDMVRRFPLAEISADQDASFRPGALTSVDPEARKARLRSGEWLPYDALLVATGARTREVLPGARAFDGRAGTSDLTVVLDAVRAGQIRRIAFAVPEGVSWPLPLYELALLTAWWLGREQAAGVELTLVTPERQPLGLLGGEASARVRALLEERGIELITGTRPLSADGERLTLADGSALPADHTVTIPGLEGRGLFGLPADAEGFTPVDTHGRVKGVDGVYAAGDGADFPVKQGGLATQQADAAAEAIAALLGADRTPQAFQPILRAILLTGSGRLYFEAELREGAPPPTVAERPLWSPPGKIAGHYLAPYLARAEGETSRPDAFEDRDDG